MKKKENLMPTWNYENITFKIKLSDHNPPHVHAEADGKAVLLVLKNSNVFAGGAKAQGFKKSTRLGPCKQKDVSAGVGENTW